MSNSNYKIYIVHIDKNIDLYRYLYLLSVETRKQVISYKNDDDRLRAFTSALLKSDVTQHELNFQIQRAAL
jgi:hypothetical protein